jgi:hypothetical protein
MDDTEKHPLQIIIENTDFAEALRSYSGCGMSSEECLGVTISHSLGLGRFIADVMHALINFAVDEMDGDRAADIAAQAFAVMRTDSMGSGTIVYFPGVEYIKGDENGEDEVVDDQGEETPPSASGRGSSLLEG